MKSVLISIQPKWCEKIAGGRKTIELRKSKPKLALPFKCYIYCSMGDLNGYRGCSRYGSENGLLMLGGSKFSQDIMGCGEKNRTYIAYGFCGEEDVKLNGKVIGEFVCDSILCHCEMANIDLAEEQSLVSREKIREYAGEKEVFGWHISDLVIYDKPKELSEFAKPGKCPYNPSDEGKCTYKYHCFRAGQLERCGEFMQRAPQSWCYVEELEKTE